MAKVYISLGTNLGDKEQNLRTAVQKIEEQVGKVISLSAFYITAPWGFDSEHSFLNAAACVERNCRLWKYCRRRRRSNGNWDVRISLSVAYIATG